jgi:hypothetical protein
VEAASTEIMAAVVDENSWRDIKGFQEMVDKFSWRI